MPTTEKMAAMWVGPGISEHFYLCGIYQGFAAIFPKTLEQARFEKDWKKAREIPGVT